MTLDELTRHMNAFVEQKGWYAPDSPREQTPRNLVISLVLESAELLEHFQWQADAAHPQRLADEMADVALYLLQLAHVTGVDLEHAILDKLARNRQRVWPDATAVEASADRPESP